MHSLKVLADKLGGKTSFWLVRFIHIACFTSLQLRAIDANEVRSQVGHTHVVEDIWSVDGSYLT